jgi:anti-anti-sigma regulatory factor
MTTVEQAAHDEPIFDEHLANGILELTASPVTEMDISTAPACRDAFKAALADEEVSAVILDLGSLHFIGVTGIHLLQDFHRHAIASRKSYVIDFIGNEPAAKIVDTLRLNNRLNIVLAGNPAAQKTAS